MLTLSPCHLVILSSCHSTLVLGSSHKQVTLDLGSSLPSRDGARKVFGPQHASRQRARYTIIEQRPIQLAAVAQLGTNIRLQPIAARDGGGDRRGFFDDAYCINVVVLAKAARVAAKQA